MADHYLLDTCVLSETTKAAPEPRVVARLQSTGGRHSICTVTWHELNYGVARLPKGKRRTALEHYLNNVVRPNVDMLSYDHDAALWHALERARLEKAGRTLPFADSQIAAIAASRGHVLVTRNTKDFAHYRGLKTENWWA